MMHGNTQVKGGKQREKGVHQIPITTANGIPVQGSTKLACTGGDVVSEEDVPDDNQEDDAKNKAILGKKSVGHRGRRETAGPRAGRRSWLSIGAEPIVKA